MLLQDHSVLKDHVSHVDWTGLMHCHCIDICAQDTSAMFSCQFLFSTHFFSVKCSQYVLNILIILNVYSYEAINFFNYVNHSINFFNSTLIAFLMQVLLLHYSISFVQFAGRRRPSVLTTDYSDWLALVVELIDNWQWRRLLICDDCVIE